MRNGSSSSDAAKSNIEKMAHLYIQHIHIHIYVHLYIHIHRELDVICQSKGGYIRAHTDHKTP